MIHLAHPNGILLGRSGGRPHGALQWQSMLQNGRKFPFSISVGARSHSVVLTYHYYTGTLRVTSGVAVGRINERHYQCGPTGSLTALPKVSDINKQRAEAIAGAKAQVAEIVQKCAGSPYQDEDFNGDDALFIDPDEPPSMDEMGRPDRNMPPATCALRLSMVSYSSLCYAMLWHGMV